MSSRSGPKLTANQKAAVLALITDVIVVRSRDERFAVAEIERQLGVTLTQQQVSYYLVKMRNEWAERKERNIEVDRAEEEAHLRYIRTQSYDAWERSQKSSGRNDDDEFSELVIQIEDGSLIDLQPGKRKKRKASTTPEQGEGNPKFLAVALRASAQIAELLGLNVERTLQQPLGMNLNFGIQVFSPDVAALNKAIAALPPAEMSEALDAIGQFAAARRQMLDLRARVLQTEVQQ